MKDKQKEPLLERLAKEYIDEEGRRLTEEARRLEAEASAPLPRLDARVRKYQALRRRNRYVAAFGAVAAGLLLVLLLPRLRPLTPEANAPVSPPADTLEAPPEAAAQPAEPSQRAETGVPQEAMEAGEEGTLRYAADAASGGGAAEPSTPLAEDSLAAKAPASPAEPVEPPAAFQADGSLLDFEEEAPFSSEASHDSQPEDAEAPIPQLLSFSLPEEFTVESVRQDQGETLYYLADANLDDVVLSTQDAATAPVLATGGLVEVRGDGQTAYGLSGSDAQFLTFDWNGLRYRLTCRHDIHTLLSLWRHITSA